MDIQGIALAYELDGVGQKTNSGFKNAIIPS
jgi:hypothetical protein